MEKNLAKEEWSTPIVAYIMVNSKMTREMD